MHPGPHFLASRCPPQGRCDASTALPRLVQTPCSRCSATPWKNFRFLFLLKKKTQNNKPNRIQAPKLPPRC